MEMRGKNFQEAPFEPMPALALQLPMPQEHSCKAEPTPAHLHHTMDAAVGAGAAPACPPVQEVLRAHGQEALQTVVECLAELVQTPSVNPDQARRRRRPAAPPCLHHNSTSSAKPLQSAHYPPREG